MKRSPGPKVERVPGRKSLPLRVWPTQNLLLLLVWKQQQSDGPMAVNLFTVV